MTDGCVWLCFVCFVYFVRLVAVGEWLGAISSLSALLPTSLNPANVVKARERTRSESDVRREEKRKSTAK